MASQTPLTIYSYGTDELQTIGVCDNGFSKWVVYIHGGAWQDYSQDMHMCDAWIGQLAHKNVSTAALNYRLSPAVQHPAHMEDVKAGLNYLDANFHVDEVVLVGHSAGAFLSLQAVEQGDEPVRSKIAHVVSVEGIVDLPALEKENSGYAGFVTKAFGSDRQEWERVTPGKCPRPLTIIHSQDDELLDELYQPVVAMQRNPHAGRIHVKGKHDQVPTSPDFVNVLEPVL